MLKNIITFILFIFAATMWGQPASEQQKLEDRKAKIQQQIIENERLLQNAKKQEKSVLSVIGIKDQKIRLKENLINTNEKQTKVLNNNLFVNEIEINKLKKELDILKQDYANMILKSYKSRSDQSRAMFLLSSESFSQAYKRAQYMKQYANYRKMQSDEIVDKTQDLSGYNKKLNIQKAVKVKLIKENEKEKQILEKEKKEQVILANTIKKDKRKIAGEIKNQQQEARKIDRQIDKLIRDAIAEANKRAAAKAAKANPNKVISAAETKANESSTKIVLTTEGKIESDNFKANKGRLPWPVERGAVTLKYGDQPHPLFPSLTVHNSGLEISTDKGASARAVFAGEVTQVQVVSPVNKAVIIKHGDFFTVYQNLSKVNVRVGDRVSIKQNLGQIRTSGDTGNTVLKFMVSQNAVSVNPAQWITPQ
jgi:septal ring factor EnvC (AmiA/AmiB activator)